MNQSQPLNLISGTLLLFALLISLAPVVGAPARARTVPASVATPSGQAALAYDAPRGTSFDVFRKGPGDADFLKVGDDLIVKILTLTGLAAGNHEFKVLPRNSRGTGPESDASLVNVG